MNSKKTLYLCYFGLHEPLVQTQVLPYLREIQKDKVKVSLITFEQNLKKWTVEQIAVERQKLAAENIDWHCLAYHKRPSAPATAFDVLCGAWLTWRLMRREKFNIIHSRVHVPMLMGTLARKFSRHKPKLIFDIRGFFPEEYVDAGNWKPDSLIYRLTKRVERWLIKEADGFVVLTEKAREILFPESRATGEDKFKRPVEVIPCCVDLKKFEIDADTARREIRQKFNLENRLVIIYLGSIGTWYLADEMADLMQTAFEKSKSVFAMVLTQSAPEIMAEKLLARGFKSEDFLIKRVSHNEIPKYLSAADVAISFIKPCFSKLSSSPTKIAEYLASGLPIITNSGVGDVAEQIEVDKTGSVVENFTREMYLITLREIEILRSNENLSDVCQESAKNRFDLEQIGGKFYRRLYKNLVAEK